MTLILILLSMMSSVALAGSLPESPPSIWNPGSYGVSATSELFTSNANYGEERGSYSKLEEGHSITVFETRPRARYAFTHAISAFAGTSFAQTKAVDSDTEKTSANLTEVYGGFDWQLNRRWWRVVPEFEFSYPVTATDPDQTVPLTSDGVWFMRAGVFLFKPYKRIRFESYLGLHYPGEGLAKRFNYSLASEVALIRGFSIGGGVYGYETIVSDDKTQAERTRTTDRANAGSQRFWAYDPALLEARAWVGFRADRAFTFRLGYGKTINGVRTAEGSSVLLSIAFSSPGDKSRGRAIRAGHTVEDEEIIEPEVEAPREEFETEPEVVDPELFDQQQRKTKSKLEDRQ
ncbi:MAG TPA: hypothetical protein VM432_02055 [Bdellovibrionales bacterium]|nr:hypothetical protein [Bdellovibrionales bacterium]